MSYETPAYSRPISSPNPSPVSRNVSNQKPILHWDSTGGGVIYVGRHNSFLAYVLQAVLGWGCPD